MRKILLASLLFIAPVFAGDYYGVTIDTTTGTADMHVGGTIGVGASSTTPTTDTIILDGVNGRLGLGIEPVVGLHILQDGTPVGGSYDTNAAMIVERNNHANVLIKSKNDKQGTYGFADANDTFIGALAYDHSINGMWLYVNNSARFFIDSNGDISIGNGVNPATERLEVKGGNIKILDGGDGIIFGDGTKQVTAVISTATFKAEVRQTALTGSIDATGYADFMAIGAAISVDVGASSEEPLIMAIANGFDSLGNIDYSATVLSTTNVQVPANETGYIYIDYNSGTPTLDYTTSTLTYGYAYPVSPTAEDWHFSIPMMKMHQYDGSVWTVTPATFLGEWVSDGSAVTDVITYALRGKFDSGRFAVAAASSYTIDHNLGIIPLDFTLLAATSGGGNLGIMHIAMTGSAAASNNGFQLYPMLENSCTMYTFQSNGLITGNGGAGGQISTTAAVEAKVILKRGW